MTKYSFFLKTSLSLLILLPLSYSCLSTPEPTPKRPKHERLFAQANIYAKDGLLQEAISTYRSVLKRKPHHPYAHRNLGITYVKAGAYKKSIKHLMKIRKRFVDDFEVHFYLGEALRAEAKYPKAIRYYEIAYEIEPKNLKVLKTLAWSYLKSNMYRQALSFAFKLKKIAPHDTQAIIIYSRTMLAAKQPQKALDAIQVVKAHSQKEELAYLLSVEGDAYYALDKKQEAEQAYLTALKDQPLLAGSLLGLGKCLLDKGMKSEKAIEYIERAVRIKPNLTEGLYILSRNYAIKNPKKSEYYFKKFKNLVAHDPKFELKIKQLRAEISGLTK